MKNYILWPVIKEGIWYWEIYTVFGKLITIEKIIFVN